MTKIQRPRAATVLCIVLLAGLPGCGFYRAVVGQGSAIAIAETPEQKHWALVGTYRNLQIAAENIAGSDEFPMQLRRAVQTVEQCVTPVLVTLETLHTELIVERLLFEQGQTVLEQVEIAATNYRRWHARAETAVTDLSKALAGEASSCTPPPAQEE